jgi:ABC transporter DrrB family efflux protein
MMNNTGPAVRVRDLHVQRGGREVLRGLTFDVPAGQVTGLLGPSGCGKTTLMRALVGVQSHVTGSIEVLGEPAGAKVLRRRIGYVTQAPSVYADLTVRQNLQFFATVLSAGRDSIERAIGYVDLADHADVTVGRLSGGQESRASLAVALLGSPQVLVLDEPTVGLDPVLRRDRRERVRVQPRDGRGRPLRAAAADARGPVAGRRHPAGAARAHRLTRHRGRVPRAGREGRRGGPAMSPRITLAVALRVLRQLRHDHRTVAMLLVVPCVLLTLLWWMFDGNDLIFNRFGPPLLALFPFIVMFLVTSVTTLRERSSGTLERLLSMPLGKADLLLGYAIAFGLVALAQATVAVGLTVGLLGLEVTGPVWMLTVVAVLDAVLGTTLGLFVSAFAETEFQAVQFMPALVLPQVLLCGLFVARDELPTVLAGLADVMPLSYAVEAMQQVQTSADLTSTLAVDLLVVGGFVAAALGLGAATLRRRTA